MQWSPTSPTRKECWRKCVRRTECRRRILCSVCRRSECWWRISPAESPSRSPPEGFAAESIIRLVFRQVILSSRSTTSSIDQTWSAIPAPIAGVTRVRGPYPSNRWAGGKPPMQRASRLASLSWQPLPDNCPEFPIIRIHSMGPRNTQVEPGLH
jgi:hypothetical protein